MILDAIRLYYSLGLGVRPVFRTFQRWMWLTLPEIFFEKPEDVFGDRLDLDSIRNHGKAFFFKHTLPLFEKDIASAAPTPTTKSDGAAAPTAGA